MSTKKVYKVFVFLEVISDKSAEEVQEQVDNLLEYGGVRDCFDSAGLDASHFVCEKVES